MATVSRTRMVAAAPRVVWDVLADFGSLSAWAPDVDHCCLLEHGADITAPGTSRRVQVGRTTLVERITDSQAPRTLAYDVEGLPRRLRRVANRWTLDPAGDGTVVTLSTTVDAGPSRLQDLAARAVARVWASRLDQLLTALARKVEATHV